MWSSYDALDYEVVPAQRLEAMLDGQAGACTSFPLVPDATPSHPCAAPSPSLPADDELSSMAEARSQALSALMEEVRILTTTASACLSTTVRRTRLWTVEALLWSVDAALLPAFAGGATLQRRAIVDGVAGG